MSAHIGGKSLVDELLQRLRLLLFRDGAYDGFTHDIAVAVNHIGGGIGKDVGSELSRLTVGRQNTHSDRWRPSWSSTSFASEIAASSPSSVKVLTPMSAPPFSASSLFSASRSESSPTQGLQVVNQKFTTVTALAENSSSLFTGFPSRSLPSKAGNFCILPSSGGVGHVAACGHAHIAVCRILCMISGYFSSNSGSACFRYC